MTDLEEFARLVLLDYGLSVVVTLRPDHSMQSSVVNSGVLPHPLRGDEVVGFVARRDARKLIHLRLEPRITIVIRSGWQWVTVEGTAQIIGPDDHGEGIDDETLRLLLREVFMAADGTHDDWDVYDQTMRDEGRAAVLITPTRIYSNKP